MKSAAIAFFSASLALALVSALPTPGRTAEPDFESILENTETYHFPEIEPEIKLTLGYGILDLSGSRRVGEYEYLRDSLVLEGVLRIFDYPHRVHLDFHEKNVKDYFGDIWYSYKENLFVRLTSRSLYHNLGTLRLVDLDPATPSPGVSLKDDGRDYAVRAGDNRGVVKLKAPNYPAHIYLEVTQIQRDGAIQQRSMGGAGFFTSQVRRSETRDLDLETTTVTAGANSHLGPVEVGYSHSEKQLRVGGDPVLYDRYAAAAAYRPPGEWPHNRISETTGGTDTLRLHTSYSGRVVAAVTVSRSDRSNDSSEAQSATFLGAGSLTLLLSGRLTVFLHYRQLDVDADNPASVTVTDRSKPANTYGDSQVRPSISTSTNTGSLAVRYKPFAPLSLKAQYVHEDVEREDEEQWNLPKTTQKETVTLSATQRIGKAIKLDAEYVHQAIRDPAYNVDPERSNEGRLSISWLILDKVSSTLTYRLKKEEREELHYLSESGKPIGGAKNRDVRRNMVFGTAAYHVRENLSLTASFGYLHNRIEQDIAYNLPPPGSGPGTPRVDAGAPSEDRAYTYALGLTCQPTEKIKLDASVSRITGMGDFNTNSDDLNLPVPIGSFSELETSETDVTLSGEYAFSEHFSAGLSYQYRNLDDALDNADDDLEDGRVQAVFVTLNKKW